MVTIYDIAPEHVWNDAISSKLINIQVHPTLPLEIYDYSQICQFQRAWNKATLAARGLIVNSETKEVVARPLGKFFNYNEPDAPESLMVGPVVVTDKADGSMGISYPTLNGSLNISTRGSFQSEQAKHATEIYLQKYDGTWTPDPDYTYIWEIIYPTNRIVVNYGELDDLVLISRVNKVTGISEPASKAVEWNGLKVEEFPYSTLTAAVEAEPRDNVEGLVAHFTDSDTRVKIKQADYVTLHRIITGASSRRIHEMLATGSDFQSWLVGLPDEFVEFVETTRDRLLAEYAEVEKTIQETYAEALNKLPEGYTQKEFAAIAVTYGSPLRGYLFAYHKNQDIKSPSIIKSIWQQIEPEFEKPFWNLNGKTA